MMKRNTISFPRNRPSVLLLVTCMLLSGCQVKEISETLPTDSETHLLPQEQVSSQMQDTTEESPSKIRVDGIVTWDEFPTPTAETFSLTNQEAALYNAAVSICSNQALAASFCPDSTDLVLPLVSLYGQYENDDGTTTYVAGYVQCWYYNLGTGLAINDPVYTYGSAGGLAAYTLDGSGALVSFEETHDGENAAEAVSRVCGPLSELANRLNSGAEVEKRCIPDQDHETLVKQYLSYFFS